MHGLQINFSSIFNYLRCSLKNLKFCHVHLQSSQKFFFISSFLFFIKFKAFCFVPAISSMATTGSNTFSHLLSVNICVERWLVKNFHVIKLLVSFFNVEDSMKKAFFEMALAIKVPHTIRLVTYFCNSALQESNWIESAAIVLFHLTDFGRIKAHLRWKEMLFSW